MRYPLARSWEGTTAGFDATKKKKKLCPCQESNSDSPRPYSSHYTHFTTTASLIFYNNNKTLYYAKPQLFESRTATSTADVFSDICCLGRQPWREGNIHSYDKEAIIIVKENINIRK